MAGLPKGNWQEIRTNLDVILAGEHTKEFQNFPVSESIRSYGWNDPEQNTNVLVDEAKSYFLGRLFRTRHLLTISTADDFTFVRRIHFNAQRERITRVEEPVRAVTLELIDDIGRVAIHKRQPGSGDYEMLYYEIERGAANKREKPNP